MPINSSNPQNSFSAAPDVDKKLERRHYHANYIRALFFTAAIIMLIFSPFFKETIALSIILMIFGVVLIVLAGITNRQLKGIFFINVLASLFIIVILEFISFNVTFLQHPYLVLMDQFVSLILLIALYYCLRTLRGFMF